MVKTLLGAPSDHLLNQIEDAITENQFLDAHSLSATVSLPLLQWPAGKARKIAAHLIETLGDARAGGLLDWLNWRADRDNDHLYFLALFSRVKYKSTYELIPEVEARIERRSGLMDKPNEARLLGFLSWCYATLHDFPTAHQHCASALELDPNQAWLHVQQSIVFDIEDRYEESRQALMKAIALRPTYRPAVLQLSRVLMHLGHDEEAMKLLQKTHERTQNASFVLQLQTFYSERDMHEECARCLDQAEHLLPLRNEAIKEWFAGRRADCAYIAGDMESFRKQATQVKSGFHKKALENFEISAAATPYRVKLDVPFIRQHNMTCAPATLASLAKYWSVDADHLEIAAAICYDGTPWHKERKWAEKQGFVTREFRVTREILYDLIDRGIPFTLTTASVTSSHLQACIGYDRRLDLILLRDPTHRHYVEMLITGLFSEHPLGPRGMLLLPAEKRHLIAGLHFPDAAAFDALHDLSVALDENDRLQADAAMALMRTVAADKPLLWEASYRFHSYYGNLSEQGHAVEQLLLLHPDHPSFLLMQSFVLKQMQRTMDLRSLLEKAVIMPHHDPVFDSEYGEILLDDARDLPTAERMLLRALRRQSSQGHVYESLARCREKQRRFDEVARLRKVASCVAPSSEFYARAYFESCRAIARTDQALQYLTERKDKLGRKDSGPWITLANALHYIDRQQEACAIMDEGMRQLPDDGDLLCRYGAMMMQCGEQQRAKGLEMIRKAREKMPEYQWQREMALAHAFLGQRLQAIQHWKTFLSLQPLAITGYRHLVTLLADEEGVESALNFLKLPSLQHPTFADLWALLAEWQAFVQDPGLKNTLDHILAQDPSHAWALRERSTFHMRLGEQDQALADARVALEKTPYLAESHGVLASILRSCSHIEEADEALRQALAINIDYTFAAGILVQKAQGTQAQLDALDYLFQQMTQQVSRGDIVIEYQSLAYPLLIPQILLEQLREFCRARPDLWQTWSACKLQCQSMNLAEEALECANTMTNAFPLLPRSWLDLADCHHLQRQYQEECDALQKALDLSPGWDFVVRRLADAYERLGRLDEAEQVLRRAINLEPLVAGSYIALASLLTKRHREEDALAILRQCVQIIPLARSAWAHYTSLAVSLESQKLIEEDLQTISRKHEHRASWWLVAAETCSQLGQPEIVSTHCRRGLALEPKNHDLRDLLVFQLALDQQFEEAEKICLETVDNAPVSREMEGRYCWVLLQSGKPVQAIERMELLLKKEPDYVWIMTQLASCRMQRSQWTELKRLAEHWVRMDPRNESAYSYLGTAQLQLNLNAQAMVAFQQAVTLDPSSQYACRQLFDMQLAEKHFKAARSTLIHLQHYSSGAATLCDEIDLLIAEKHYQDAIQMIDQLLQKKDCLPQQLRWLRDRLSNAGQSSYFTRWLNTYMATAKLLHSAPVIVWIESMTAKQKQAKCAKQLIQLNMTNEARADAWIALIEATNQPQFLAVLDSWVKQHSTYFQNHLGLWNAVGYSYTAMNQFAKTAEWLKEWYKRDDATAVTYHNIATALDELNGIHAGDAPRRKMLERFPTTHLMREAVSKLAMCDLIAGRIDQAKQQLANAETKDLSPLGKYSTHLAHCMLLCTSNESKSQGEYLHALSIFNSYPKDATMKHFQIAAETYLAQQLPSFRGNIKRLRKQWRLDYPHPLNYSFSSLSKTSRVVLVILAYGVFRWLLSAAQN